MIKKILLSIFTYFNRKVLKMYESEKRLKDLEKDVDIILDGDRGRKSFTTGLANILSDLKVIKNDIKHISERINRIEDRIDRRQIITPVDFDRRIKCD